MDLNGFGPKKAG